MISRDDVQKLAILARIKLLPEEADALAKDMASILGYIDEIKSATKTDDSDSHSEKEKTRNVLRNDTHPHETGIHTEAILAEAPEREENYVKVKKIL